MKSFVEKLENDSQAIEDAKELFDDPSVPGELAVIKSNFSILTDTIKDLQARQPLVKAMETVEQLQNELTLEPYAGKLKNLLTKNPGFKELNMTSKVLRGSVEDFEGDKPGEVCLFANAPITSVNCERTFSTLKDILTSKRNRLSVNHLKDIIILQWNNQELD